MGQSAKERLARAIRARAVAEGARVAVTGTNPETIEKARAELGNEVLFLRSEAGDVGEQKKLARRSASRWEKSMWSSSTRGSRR